MASILPRIADGESAAIQECVERYGGLVWSIARRLLGDGTEARDATRDAFLEIWAGAERFDPKLVSERTHVAMMARRSAIDRRRDSQEGRHRAPVPDASRRPGDPGDQSTERDPETRLAARALRGLSETRRHVLELAVHRGLGHRRIAEAIGIPPGTVKTHVTRGLEEIREALLSAEAAD